MDSVRRFFKVLTNGRGENATNSSIEMEDRGYGKRTFMYLLSGFGSDLFS